MPEYCRKTFLFLARGVAILGSVAYCIYLIWLLVYLKGNGYYWFFAFIPAFLVMFCLIAVVRRDWVTAATLALHGIMLLLACSLTMLTRQAYYHLSADDLIGPQWVIMSLKGSIVFFVCGFLAREECRLQRILNEKDILSRALLDFVDIFNLVELLSLNHCVGIGSSVTEGSNLEMSIQAFCSMSLFIMIHTYAVSRSLTNRRYGTANRMQNVVDVIYLISPIYQNIPFLIIRIIVWIQYDVFSLGFMVKNIWAIVVCYALIHQVEADGEEPHNVNDNQPV